MKENSSTTKATKVHEGNKILNPTTEGTEGHRGKTPSHRHEGHEGPRRKSNTETNHRGHRGAQGKTISRRTCRRGSGLDRLRVGRNRSGWWRGGQLPRSFPG